MADSKTLTVDENDTATADIRGNIISEQFTLSNNVNYDINKSNYEEVDIMSDYYWTIDKFVQTSGKTCDLPHCYAIEYSQAHNSAVTNFANSVSAAVTAIKNIDLANVDNAVNQIQKLCTSLMKSATEDTEAPKEGEGDDKNKNNQQQSSLFTTLKNHLNTAAGWLNQGLPITNGITSSRFLQPYKLLYWLNPTNKRFVFPMVAQPPTQNLTNSYGEQNSDTSFISANGLISKLTGYAGAAVGIARDINDMASLITGNISGSASGWFGTGVEKAKFFQYPQETEEYTISFPLINTVASTNGIPTWMKNYKFIMLFTLRNMIFRKDNAAFYPPLFYDLIIPGVIRQPFCYVSNVNVVPFGMVRMKSYDKGFGFASDIRNKKFSVAVPEQWHVTIKFKSLLATSANMVLSSMYDLGIEAETNDTWASGANMGDTLGESIYNSRSNLA